MSQKGTIIYVGGFELPDKNAAAHRVISNSKIMRNLGYDVVLIGIDKSKKSCGKLFRYDNDFHGFECWSLAYPITSFSWLKYILGYSALIDFIEIERINKVVSVICYNYPAISQLRINTVCKRKNIKLFADATEWYNATGGNLLYRLIKWIDTSIRMYYSNVKSDGILTTSKFLTSFYEKKDKITVELPTLYDTSNFKVPVIIEDGLRKKFIYVGVPFEAARVNKNRTNLKERLDLSISLFSEVYKVENEFDFDIYGIDKKDYLTVFPEHKELLIKMSDCVRFHGRQPHKAILKHLANSDFCIFFRDETRVTLAGFPSKLAESISCGTPVVSNKMLSVEKYADLGGLFLAEKGKELLLIEKIMKLSRKEINTLKKISFESKVFDYRKFQLQLKTFLEDIGV